MPAFNFQNRFVRDIESGFKHQTIRAKRSQRPRFGQTAYLFSGMRSTQCRRIGAYAIQAVRDIRIDSNGVIIDDSALPKGSLEAFAADDGFESWAEMLQWFADAHGLPFHGDLIIWCATLPLHAANPGGPGGAA